MRPRRAVKIGDHLRDRDPCLHRRRRALQVIIPSAICLVIDKLRIRIEGAVLGAGLGCDPSAISKNEIIDMAYIRSHLLSFVDGMLFIAVDNIICLGFWPLVSMGAILGSTMRSPFTGVVFPSN